MTDMAAIHEIAALSHTGDAAAGDRSGIHGHLLADRAAGADLELCQLAPIAEGLRRRAQRRERIDRAAVADRGLRGDMDLRNQLAVVSDRDVGANNAIRPYHRVLADHGAILDARGGIDHAHQKGPLSACHAKWEYGRIFQVVSARERHCPVTCRYRLFQFWWWPAGVVVRAWRTIGLSAPDDKTNRRPARSIRRPARVRPGSPDPNRSA